MDYYDFIPTFMFIIKYEEEPADVNEDSDDDDDDYDE